MKPPIFLPLLLALGLSKAALAQTATAVANTAAPVQTELFSTASSLPKKPKLFQRAFSKLRQLYCFSAQNGKKPAKLLPKPTTGSTASADYEGFIQKLDYRNLFTR